MFKLEVFILESSKLNRKPGLNLPVKFVLTNKVTKRENVMKKQHDIGLVLRLAVSSD